MTITKEDLIKLVTQKGNIPSDKSRALIDTMLSVMKEKLIEGENVKLQRFGSFVPVEREARKGRDFNTGETIDLPSGKTIVFKPSDFLKAFVKEAGRNQAEDS